jgi:MFS-type transporter involved in bile tolerance (Atg22 family)
MIVVYSAALGTAMPLFRVLILENERIGPNLAGSAFGLLHTVNRTGAMALPFTMGAIIDATGEHWHGFLLLAALYAIGVVLITQIKETGWNARETVATSHYR